MKSEEENLRKLLVDFTRPEKNGASGGHLRDEDFIRLVKSDSPAEAEFTKNGNDHSPERFDEFVSLRRHLADCDSCLAQFKDFYAFYAPPENGEPVAANSEIAAAWSGFATRIAGENVEKKSAKESLWARLFPAVEKKTNYFPALGWGLAALLLVSSAVSFFVAYNAKNQNSELVSQIENQKQSIENQKQSYEEQLKTLEQSAQNRNSDEREKAAISAEKDELQKQIAKLQTELERARQPIAAGDLTPPKNPGAKVSPENDGSLIAVNTPIYDVFPADAAVRGGETVRNNLTVPKEAKSIVLILNAAGSAEFQTYRAEILSSSGASLWRGAGLKKDNLGNFTFTISRAALRNGDFRLKLYGQNGAQPTQPLAEYSLAIAVK